MSARVRFWCLVVDVLAFVHAPYGMWLWAIQRLSDATDWGDGAKCGEEAPW